MQRALAFGMAIDLYIRKYQLIIFLNLLFMASPTETISTLNDLVEINNDRVAGFEKAISSIKEGNQDLKSLFEDYASQSRRFSQELSAAVEKYNGEVETGNSLGGTLHRAWIDIKSLFGGSDRESILSEAEKGEDAIKAAYAKALENEELPLDVRNFIAAQSVEIESAHDRIKALRDTVKAIS